MDSMIIVDFFESGLYGNTSTSSAYPLERVRNLEQFLAELENLKLARNLFSFPSAIFSH